LRGRPTGVRALACLQGRDREVGDVTKQARLDGRQSQRKPPRRAGPAAPADQRRTAAVALAGLSHSPAAILALQRTVGNRVVVQRKELSMDEVGNKVHESYLRFPHNNRDRFDGCRPDWARKEASDAVASWWRSDPDIQGKAELYTDKRHRENTGLGIPSMNLEKVAQRGGRFIYHVPTVVSKNDQSLVDAKENPPPSPQTQGGPISPWEMAKASTPTSPSGGGKSAWDEEF
jgi:hypothetical protein